MLLFYEQNNIAAFKLILFEEYEFATVEKVILIDWINSL